MRIAQVAPLYESVPPRLYGGTERVVSTLTETLVALGHDVTLFASGDSRTTARLVATCPEALRLGSAARDPMLWHVLHHQAVLDRADELDVIHFHTDYLHFPQAPLLRRARLTTLHGRLDLPDLEFLYGRFRHEPVVSISTAQRRPLPMANWIGNVPHGLPQDRFAAGAGRGGYLAFLGRISPEKRVDRAIAIARRAGLPLRIAAKIDPADRDYYEREIRPLLALPGVEFLGEIGEADKQAFLGEAHALLFPIDWPEPFGLVMIEALACATPVIAFRRGSVPEVIEHGRSGYIVDSIEAAIEAVRHLGAIRRQDCRAAFAARFTAERMARDYLDLYARLAARHARAAAGLPAAWQASIRSAGRLVHDTPAGAGEGAA